MGWIIEIPPAKLDRQVCQMLANQPDLYGFLGIISINGWHVAVSPVVGGVSGAFEAEWHDVPTVLPNFSSTLCRTVGRACRRGNSSTWDRHCAQHGAQLASALKIAFATA